MPAAAIVSFCGDSVWMYPYPQGWGRKKMPGVQSGRDYPEYIAFRTAYDGGHLVTVVAALEPDDGSLFPWAMRYHAQAPRGEFRKVPGNYIRLRIDTAVAKSMIDIIKLGRSLPTEFVAKLPIIE
jgi:hypothetical protein